MSSKSSSVKVKVGKIILKDKKVVNINISKNRLGQITIYIPYLLRLSDIETNNLRDLLSFLHHTTFESYVTHQPIEVNRRRVGILTFVSKVIITKNTEDLLPVVSKELNSLKDLIENSPELKDVVESVSIDENLERKITTFLIKVMRSGMF